MKKILFTLCIAIICLLSCSTETNESTEYVKKIPVNINSALQVRLNYLFQESVEHIILDDTKSVIKDIDKIELDKKSIYMLDEGLHNMLRFSRKGEFLNFCGTKGRGPGELFYPTDFTVEDSIIKVQDGSQKMKIFTKQGNFKRAKELPVNALSFEFFEEKLYLYKGYNNDNETSYRLFAYDGKNLKKYLEVSEDNVIPPYPMTSKNFSKVNGALHFQESLNNVIYKIKNNEVRPVYEIDFGQYNLPEKVLRLQDQFEILDVLRSAKYASIYSYFENDTYLLFKFFINRKPYYLFQNKKSHKTLIAKNFKNDISYIPFGEPMALTAKNELIVKTPPYLILEREKELRETLELDKTKEDEFFSLYTKLTTYSNPIISIYKLDF